MRTLALIIIVLLMSPVLGQEEDVFEVEIALAYGSDVFEPGLWRVVSATEEDTRTRVHWTASDMDALGFMDYLHFTDGLPDIGTFFDVAWFDGIFTNYDRYIETDHCVSGDTHLLHFTMIFEGRKYLLRYWIIPASPTRMAAMFIVFPAHDMQNMNRYAARFNPALPGCFPIMLAYPGGPTGALSG